MWEDQSKQYWKEKEAIKAKDAKKNNLVYGLVAFFIVCCVGGFAVGRLRQMGPDMGSVDQEQPAREEEEGSRKEDVIKLSSTAKKVEGIKLSSSANKKVEGIKLSSSANKKVEGIKLFSSAVKPAHSAACTTEASDDR